MNDVIDLLSPGLSGRLRPQVAEYTQRAWEVLVFGEDSACGVSSGERLHVALHVARLLGVAEDFFAELAQEDPFVSPRLGAAERFATVMVREPARLTDNEVAGLRAAGWEDTEIVVLAQLVAFLTFFLTLVHAAEPGEAHTHRPSYSTVFRSGQLPWEPWVPPLPPEEVDVDAVVEPSRVRMPYFRMLARDPQALRARTLVDFGIFGAPEGGADQGLRELAAVTVSTVNGCAYCASVHEARARAHRPDLSDDVAAVLASGPDAEVRDPAAAAVVRAATRLSTRQFDGSDVAALHAVGLDDAGVMDIVSAAAFFQWANRLMLGLGTSEAAATNPTRGERG
ncbi:peroxidase-related enzyme [Corynebacterium sp. 13CS0277]|uniref:peroxidase-related enzyme n=1 Tax=Corynebacterium sp. 13CS0277 TaxID=2071994 RepID=UPI00130486FA|nr:peroxidase-related enzyme [Corynebacterium sp. 13CS0277]